MSKKNEYENKGYLFIKRFLDIVCSGLAIVVLSPIMIITAIAIMIESPGNPIFAQDRVGRNGKIFKMYKFRSMCLDAEEKLKKLQEKNECHSICIQRYSDVKILAFTCVSL